jgi:predicted RND superfamily exporter protein
LLVVSIFWAIMAAQIGFDYEFEKFFPADDDDTEFYENYRNTFENDYDFLLICIKSKTTIFDVEFLQNVDSLTEKLKVLEFVESVSSPTQFTIPVSTGFGFSKKKLLRSDSREKLVQDSIKIYETDEWVGSFIAKDAKSLVMILKTTPLISKKKSDQVLGDIENVLQNSPFSDALLAGKLKAQKIYLDMIQYEFVMFILIAIILVIVVLYLTFKTFWGVWVPLTTVLGTLLWTLGFMFLTGKKIDVMTVLIPPILFVVGMSDVIHITVKYLDELRKGLVKKEAIRITIKEVGLATFLTTLTTAIGFLSLYTSHISPIREFGLYTAVGVWFAYILAFTLLPSVLLLAPEPTIAKRESNSIVWDNLLRWMFLKVFGNIKLILIFFLLITSTSLYFISKIEVDNHLLEDLKPSDPFRQVVEFFEEEYSGMRPFEIQVNAVGIEDDMLDYEILKNITILEYLSDSIFSAGSLKSPLTIIKFANRSMNGGKNYYYKLPETQELYASLKDKLDILGVMDRAETKLLMSEDLKIGRITGLMPDLGSKKMRELEALFNQLVKERVDESIISVRLTGSSRLIDKNINYLAMSMIEGLLLAFIIIALIAGLLFKSLRIILIAIITNALPLIFIAGIMGVTGIELKMATSLIFTIAFGIAVDDTIHFLSRLKLELDKGKSLIYSIKRTFLGTGKAIMMTSVVLVCGFLSMISSNFMSTFYVGLLISITLFLATIIDLTLLPIILLWLNKNKSKS